MSARLEDLAEEIARLPGVQAVAIADVVGRASRGIAIGAPVHRGDVESPLLMERVLATLEAAETEEIHVALGAQTVLARDYGPCAVAVAYPRGHLVAKSIQRMLRRAVARADKAA